MDQKSKIDQLIDLNKQSTNILIEFNRLIKLPVSPYNKVNVKRDNKAIFLLSRYRAIEIEKYVVMLEQPRFVRVCTANTIEENNLKLDV